MPQVFGEGQLDLMRTSSLWTHADFVDDVNEHENALAEAGFDNHDLPVNLDKSGLNPRGGIWGQHLRSDGTHHYWAIAHVANPDANPNQKDSIIGGAKPRYSVDIHAIPKNSSGRAKGTQTHVWHGNNIIHFLKGQRRSTGDIGLTWPEMQKTIQRGPKK